MNLSCFKNKKVNPEKLLSYGFKACTDFYRYQTDITEDFCLTVKIFTDGKLVTEVYDKLTDEPYTLYLLEDAEGAFVGIVKSAVENALKQIAENCYDENIFKSSLTQAVTDYIYRTYGDSLEFLWADTPDCAIARRADNKKWYLVIMTVKASKLGIKSDDLIEIIDLRTAPDKLSDIVDGERYFYGYHMNKKHWITLLLDGSVNVSELFTFIDDSYKLASLKKVPKTGL